MKDVELKQQELNLLVFYNSMSKTSQLWIMAQAASMAKDFADRSIVETIIDRHHLTRHH
jgi:hypothetical protein